MISPVFDAEMELQVSKLLASEVRLEVNGSEFADGRVTSIQWCASANIPLVGMCLCRPDVRLTLRQWHQVINFVFVITLVLAAGWPFSLAGLLVDVQIERIIIGEPSHAIGWLLAQIEMCQEHAVDMLAQPLDVLDQGSKERRY